MVIDVKIPTDFYSDMKIDVDGGAELSYDAELELISRLCNVIKKVRGVAYCHSYNRCSLIIGKAECFKWENVRMNILRALNVPMKRSRLGGLELGYGETIKEANNGF